MSKSRIFMWFTVATVKLSKKIGKLGGNFKMEK